MNKTIRIANVQAFWGDYSQAPAQMLRDAPYIDYLTLDYLAEVSMSILAKQQSQNPNLGYAKDFLQVVKSIAPYWQQGSQVRVVSNAGGLAPAKCAEHCAEVLRAAGCKGKRIGVVSGDSVLSALQAAIGDEPDFRNLDTGDLLSQRSADVVTANAYFGAEPIVRALKAECDLVITGRVADPSMVVGPCLFEHNWPADAFDQIAGATVAGHLIECGTQVTGGISTQWLSIDDIANIGYPIVEVDRHGDCVVTKPSGTSGRVNIQTVKEQLLYELGDPNRYLSPDATVSFLSLQLKDLGYDRVSVRGAKGTAPPETLKVSGTQHVGYHAAGHLVVFGEAAVAKANRCGQAVLSRLKAQGLAPAESNIECLGAGATVPLPHLRKDDLNEVVLRVSVADPNRDVVSRFAADWTSLVCCGPQGTTGYAGGRPRVSETYGYWPCLIHKEAVHISVEVIEV